MPRPQGSHPDSREAAHLWPHAAPSPRSCLCRSRCPCRGDRQGPPYCTPSAAWRRPGWAGGWSAHSELLPGRVSIWPERPCPAKGSHLSWGRPLPSSQAPAAEAAAPWSPPPTREEVSGQWSGHVPARLGPFLPPVSMSLSWIERCHFREGQVTCQPDRPQGPTWPSVTPGMPVRELEQTPPGGVGHVPPWPGC